MNSDMRPSSVRLDCVRHLRLCRFAPCLSCIRHSLSAMITGTAQRTTDLLCEFRSTNSLAGDYRRPVLRLTSHAQRSSDPPDISRNTMNPANLPFDSESMLQGLRNWVECESPTWDTAAVTRMLDLAAREMAIMGA